MSKLSSRDSCFKIELILVFIYTLTMAQFLLEHIHDILLTLAAFTTDELNRNQDGLQQCKWTDGESNPDTGFSELACSCAHTVWSLVQQKYPLLETIDMRASIPDINLEFSEQGVQVSKSKIELKSSKSHVMPGSTIGKLDINQPLIYCHRPKQGEVYECRYGQYHTAMGESDVELFQDRTPRPQINFTKLSTQPVQYTEKKKEDWIPHYGKCAVNRLRQPVSHSWQDTLTRSILWEALQSIDTLEDLQQLRESVRPT